MSDQIPQNTSDEIDLGVLLDKLKSIFKSILIGIVQVIQFFWQHKFRLAIILAIGLGINYLFSKQVDKVYVNEFLVITNFESNEYLYNKVKSINSKLNSKDTLYLKQVFGESYERVKELEVVPVIDVYSLVNSSEENREIFELLLDEYGDISFLEEEININEYPTHKIKLYIKGLEGNETISNKLYSFLSDNTYYNELKLSSLQNYKEQLEQNKVIRAQIDSIIKEQKGSAIHEINSNAISFSGSQNLNELLTQKKSLLNNDLMLRNQLSSEDEVLKTIDSSFGVLSEQRNISFITIPLILVGIYILFFFFRYLRLKILNFIKQIEFE